MLFFWNRRKNALDWIWKVATQVKDTPFGLSFLAIKKREPHIGDMARILSLIIKGITPNGMMTKKYISGGTDNQS